MIQYSIQYTVYETQYRISEGCHALRCAHAPGLRGGHLPFAEVAGSEACKLGLKLFRVQVQKPNGPPTKWPASALLDSLIPGVYLKMPGT